ncbi:zinc finger protein 316 [Drosophila kikkawai]|uniref:Zinc finger protein 316 n=1 Tax=Drosophila kikkawai TaxID=30033 RepID=A0A6P4I4A0_DROKI|nr:aspartic and glutamic acid-rich protein [Drosophila kikkawai]
MEADITPVAETNGTAGISPELRENAQGNPEPQQQESVKSLDGGAGAVGGIMDYLEDSEATTGNQGAEAEYLDEEMPTEEEKEADASGSAGGEEAETSNIEDSEKTAAADGGEEQLKSGEEGDKESEDAAAAEEKEEAEVTGEETTKKVTEATAGEEGDEDEAAKGEGEGPEADKDEEEGEDEAEDEGEDADGEEADEEDEDGTEDPTEEGEEVLEPEASDEEGELITGDEPGEHVDGEATAAPTRERKIEEVVDENQCRVCTSKEDLVDLFKKQIDATPADMLLVICPSVSILPKDFMPQFICTKCLESLTIAIQLRKQLETTDQDLRKRLSRSKNKVRRPRGYVVIDAPVTDSSEDEEELDDEFKVSDVGGSTSADSDSVDSDASSQMKEKKKPGRPRKTPMKRSKEEDDDEDSPSVPKKKYPTTPAASVGPFECEHCDLTFSRKQSYVLHRKTHERTEHTCPICGKKFKVEWAYKTHMERHEQERAQFRCELCSQVFRLRAELKRHMAVKHDEHGFIYECKRCQRTFLTSQRLQRHQAIGCQRPREEVRIKEEPRIKMEPRISHSHGHGNHGKRRPGEGRDLFKAVAPPTTTYWSDSFSD